MRRFDAFLLRVADGNGGRQVPHRRSVPIRNDIDRNSPGTGRIAYVK
jgi:hypothetical protein